MCFFFKQKSAYEMRISDWSSDVCSSDLLGPQGDAGAVEIRKIAGAHIDRAKAGPHVAPVEQVEIDVNAQRGGKRGGVVEIGGGRHAALQAVRRRIARPEKDRLPGGQGLKGGQLRISTEEPKSELQSLMRL